MILSMLWIVDQVRYERFQRKMGEDGLWVITGTCTHIELWSNVREDGQHKDKNY